ncbi:MAG: response regulator [Hyphomicrobiales bacterium]|nr:response regulator [Hyphomicrobiales bacterium]
MRRAERALQRGRHDDSFRLALVESLSSLGYEARGFPTAEEFISDREQQSCDCAITDVHLHSGMSGFELASLLASRGSRMPTIMITAREDAGLEAKSAACGAICLLRKPFETAALIDWLKKALKA